MMTTRFGQTNSTSTLSFRHRTRHPLSLRALAPAILFEVSGASYPLWGLWRQSAAVIFWRTTSDNRASHFAFSPSSRNRGPEHCIILSNFSKASRLLGIFSQSLTFVGCHWPTWLTLPKLVQHCRIPFRHRKVQVLCLQSLIMSSIRISLNSLSIAHGSPTETTSRWYMIQLIGLHSDAAAQRPHPIVLPE